MKKQKRVGIFDSGLGGLSVLKQCCRILPEVFFYYYGDNDRAPYGNRSEGEIAEFTAQALKRFQKIGVDAAVIACNTATAVCIDEMRRQFPFPLLGIEPSVKLAAEECDRVLVLATPRTANSDRLKSLIARFPTVRFEVRALPDLAAAVEDHFLREKPLNTFDHLPRSDCSGVVLGCTHYALITDQIREFYPNAKLYDGAEGVANRLRSILFGHDDHRQPQLNFSKMGEERVVFLGKCAKLNEFAYKTNICFQYF